MRSYVGTLLFEECLNLIPPGSDIASAADRIFTPRIQIVEEDCGTRVGNKVGSELESLGLLDLDSGQRITRKFLQERSPDPVIGTKIRTRSLSTCISEGGVCLTCYHSLSSTEDDSKVLTIGRRLLD